ncbi:hypothetical protein FXF51_01915 [Nonomuraea sp. PA05]|uniref:hypothetical protein n=1 Tax=Nonomuraea sp. PA05 TaxID=2604466 RepID=UPI0011D39805|nr:hypothetical protein [Nonomuraea sp. PA05]TYB71217.1 hypothetical protein FXF51_01915 [Nonomuraea sp. PA05]
MSLIVYKTAPGRDAYVIFRTEDDVPLCMGDRAEISDRLCMEIPPAIVDELMDRADRTGTTYNDGTGGWDDTGFMVGENMFPTDVGSRFLPRANLEEFVRAAATQDMERMVALTTEMLESGEAR